MLEVGRIVGIDEENNIRFRKLVKIYNKHYYANKLKDRYYDGHITLAEVNLGIALPDALRGLEIGCDWGAKAVDVLAGRSMFDGFVGKNGEDAGDIGIIADNNHLISEYIKACRDELKYACIFWTLSLTDDNKAKIRFHSPEGAAAKWSGEKCRIDYGFAIIDTVYEDSEEKPHIINMYTDDAVWVLTRRPHSTDYDAEEHRHKMGRPLMEPMAWNATNAKPFGRSRLKFSERELMKSYVRTICNATIGLEFATSPQKYLLGVTDEQYDMLINQKFKQYVGSILAATQNPETGQNPQFGQLAQGSIEPHVKMMRIIATQFAANTGLSTVDIGIINDANPSSSDAILAQTQTLVTMAEQLNSVNKDSLVTIARMALAMEKDVTLDELEDADLAVIPHFKNPAMPSVSVTADAAIKISSARQGFSDTDVFLEMIGFSQADIRRIKAQEQRARGQMVLEDTLNDNNA